MGWGVFIYFLIGCLLVSFSGRKLSKASKIGCQNINGEGLKSPKREGSKIIIIIIIQSIICT